MSRHAVLLTDFGHLDPYVGQMKGALLRNAPDARIVDLCHNVEPFNILQAGFFLEASRPHFPEGTVFVSVVDPGVGGDRRIILAEKHKQYFLAPDNGLLTFVLQHGGPARVRDVTPAWRQGASATFHGRDLFAPLAARIMNEVPPWQLGEEVNPHSLARLPGAHPTVVEDTVEALVLHVDRFGNCILNLDTESFGTMLFKAKCPVLTSPSEVPIHTVFTYERLEKGQLGLIRGSQGYLELALNQESAAAFLGVSHGSLVSVHLDKR